MTFTNELRRQLEILVWLSRRKAAAVADIVQAFGISEPTVKRDIANLRHLGADIISDRHHGYRLMNWPKCRRSALNWLRRERKRDADAERGLVG